MRSCPGSARTWRTSLALLDVDGNDKLDILTVSTSGTNDIWYQGDGLSFIRGLAIGGETRFTFNANVADFDDDGKPDMVLTNIVGDDYVWFNRW